VVLVSLDKVLPMSSYPESTRLRRNSRSTLIEKSGCLVESNTELRQRWQTIGELGWRVLEGRKGRGELDRQDPSGEKE
jgi:hypothetical protein